MLDQPMAEPGSDTMWESKPPPRSVLRRTRPCTRTYRYCAGSPAWNSMSPAARVSSTATAAIALRVLSLTPRNTYADSSDMVYPPFAPSEETGDPARLHIDVDPAEARVRRRPGHEADGA